MKITLRVKNEQEINKIKDAFVELSEQAYDCWMCGSSDDKKDVKFFNNLAKQFENVNWFPWNGSKRWLTKHLEPIIRKWGGGTYIEPFVGGGSVSALVRKLYHCDQRLSDANPWLMAAFESQKVSNREDTASNIVSNYADVDYWRSLKDSDLDGLSTIVRANRFAICLFTAWGNRWKSRADGSMGSENPINKRFARPEYLKNRLEHFFAVRWLTPYDTVSCVDWKEVVKAVKAGDLVYIDPPYPESLGYGNQWWSFSDQLDVVDWVVDAIKAGVNVIVSNMATIERLYRRAGMSTLIVEGPKTSKTRTSRSEVIAWHIAEQKK